MKTKLLGIGICIALVSGIFCIKQNVLTLQAQEQEDAISLADDIKVHIASDGTEEEIKLWSSAEGKYYLFLPSYAEPDQTCIYYTDEQYELYANGQSVDDGVSLAQIGKQYINGQDIVLLGEVAGQTQTISVEVMQTSQVNTMYIETESGSMDYIHEVKGNAEAGNMSLYKADGSVDYTGTLEQIRGRGNNTWLNEKKPYQIKLAEKINLLDMGSAKTWILLAGAADGSSVRNKLVYDMAQQLEIPYAQNTAFVDVYLNGEYAGLYLLSEKIQIGKNRIAIEDLEKATEKMNPDVTLEEAEKFTSEDGSRWGITDVNNPADITGGYLIERDNYFEEEASAFRLDSGEKFSLNSPKYATQEEVDYIADLMQQVENAILAADGKDPESGKDYKELIDFDGLVYKYLFDEVMKCDDGWRGSNYFYKFSDATDRKIYCGPIWDYDLSLGNAPEWFVGDEMPEGITQTRLSVWYAALWQKTEFKEAVITTYNTVFKPYMLALTEDQGGIDQYADLVSDSAHMNQVRWQDKVELATIYNTYEEQIAYLKYFINQRIQYIDQVWNEGAIYHEVLFTGVPKLYDRTDKYEYQYVADGDNAVMPATPTKAGYRFMGWYYQGTEEAFSPYQPVWSDTVIEARWEADVVIQDTKNNNEESPTMLIIMMILLLTPGIVTMKIANKKEEKTANMLMNYMLYTFCVFIVCYVALFILGSSALSSESLLSIIYVIKYAVMATGIAIVLGLGIRLFDNKFSKSAVQGKEGK